MKRAFRLHRIFIAQYLKKLMEYKVDFIVGAVGFLLSQALEILFIGIIFLRDIQILRRKKIVNCL